MNRVLQGSWRSRWLYPSVLWPGSLVVPTPERSAAPRCITESAGFRQDLRFIDDTRAFCSIPARHDMSRRLDAGFVAHLAAEHRLGEDEAMEVMHDLVVTNPRRAFKL